MSWRPRNEPLGPGGLVAMGPVVRAVVRRLADRTDLRGVVADGLLVVLGDALPWADGVIYVAQEPGAAGLWMDTRLEPSVPVHLLARALHARHGQAVVWLPDSPLVGLGALDVLDPRKLAAWAGP